MLLVAFCVPVRAQDRNFTERPTAGTAAIFQPRLSAGLDLGNGDFRQFLVFTTASNLLGEPNWPGVRQVFRLKIRPEGEPGAVLIRVSQDLDFGPSPASCFHPTISDDGETVTYHTAAALVSEDTNGLSDVYIAQDISSFLRTFRISVRAGDTADPADPDEPDGVSFAPSVSGNGGFVAFTSRATNLLPAGTIDANGSQADVFVAEITGGPSHVIEVVTLNNDTPPAQSTFANALFTTSTGMTISENGCLVVFRGAPCDWDDLELCPHPNNDCASCLGGSEEVDQIYVRDRCGDPLDRTFRVSRIRSGAQFVPGNADAFAASISHDGSAIVFSSRATNFPGDTDGGEDIFWILRNDLLSTTVDPLFVSEADGGGNSNGTSSRPAVSDTGRFVAFQSTATNLISGDTNNRSDIFAAEVNAASRSLVEIVRSSVASEPGTGQNFNITLDEADGSSTAADVRDMTAASGRSQDVFVSYESLATNLIGAGNDTNGVRDVFLTRPKEFMRGDANGDGMVDSDDFDDLFKFLFEAGPPPPCMDAADTDDSGALNLTDTFENLNPPDPNDCSEIDPTLDQLTCNTYTPCSN